MRRIASAAILGIVFSMMIRTAVAAPIEATYLSGGACDVLPGFVPLTHELGEFGGFPIDELIGSFVVAGPVVCIADDGDVLNDFEVHITNLSPNTWTDLFFVADEGNLVGNADGFVVSAASGFQHAFKIDSVGINPNLIFESIAADGLFVPGETWGFRVSNFVVTSGPAGFPLFGSVGLGTSDGLSNASILANQVVPLPAAAWLFGSALGLLGWRCRRT